MTDSVPTRLVRHAAGALLESSPQPQWLEDPTGVILYANVAAATALGYPSSQAMIGTQRTDHVPGDAREGTDGHTDAERIVQLIRADGTLLSASCRTAEVRGPSGAEGTVLFFTPTPPPLEALDSRREELHAAHIRLMADVAEVRAQIVRDLHDGAQQRLVTLALQANLLRESLSDTTQTALLDGLASDAQAAIAELRELAHGIHPSVLTSRGLIAAIRSQADHCPIPVHITDRLSPTRFSALIESNAYFFVAEALTNASKYAQASQLDVTVTLDDHLTLEITDDGIGGVSLERAGSGLHSMHDRIHAFDGTVTVESHAGAGTRIRAIIPSAALHDLPH